MNAPVLLLSTVLALAGMAAGPVFRLAFDNSVRAADWRTATSEPTGLAPAPNSHSDAVVQVYAARTFGWRGAFANHCWIAVKAAGASTYRRYEVIGWNVNAGRSAIAQADTVSPDRDWYGARPILLRDIRGARAEKIVAAVPAAVASYPYPNTYRAWPGPNSNTFIAHIAREIPDLRLALPGNAIGKDYLPSNGIVAAAPSGTGFQLSVAGLVGVLMAEREGLEINVLGLVLGVDPLGFAITIPGFGRIPSPDTRAAERDAR